MAERRDAYRILVGKYEGKRPLGDARRRWKDNVKMEFQKVRWGVAGIGLAQGVEILHLVNAVMNLRVT
jgi:hypothetical protein